MPKHDPALLDSLRQNIEALALEVALRDLSSPERVQPLAPMLAELRQQALLAGLPPSPTWPPARRTPNPGAHVVSHMQQLLAMSEKQVASEEPSASDSASMPRRRPRRPALSIKIRNWSADFILESREHLTAIEAQLLALEQDPQNFEAINTIFRGFHTIKGLAGFSGIWLHSTFRARSRNVARFGPELQAAG